jgi:hypothetical protein
MAKESSNRPVRRRWRSCAQRTRRCDHQGPWWDGVRPGATFTGGADGCVFSLQFTDDTMPECVAFTIEAGLHRGVRNNPLGGRRILSGFREAVPEGRARNPRRALRPAAGAIGDRRGVRNGRRPRRQAVGAAVARRRHGGGWPRPPGWQQGCAGLPRRRATRRVGRRGTADHGANEHGGHRGRDCRLHPRGGGSASGAIDLRIRGEFSAELLQAALVFVRDGV